MNLYDELERKSERSRHTEESRDDIWIIARALVDIAHSLHVMSAANSWIDTLMGAAADADPALVLKTVREEIEAEGVYHGDNI